MDECPSLTSQCDQETIEKVVTQTTIVSQKTSVDPSMSFLYHWMLSVMSSFLSLNNTNKKIEPQQIPNEENNTFLKNLKTTISTLNIDKENNKENINNKNLNNQQSNKIKLVNNSNNNKKNSKSDTFSTIFNPSFLTTPHHKKTLILDLDETLVHSTLKPISHHHLTVNVVIEDVDCTFYVIKRPHVDQFLEKVSEWYDLVIFTASMQQYADPLLDQLDYNKTLKKRLFRDSCLEKDGNFIKDLGRINQDLTSTIIIDNSPIAYSNNIENAIPIDTFIGEDPNDRSLLNLLPFLEVLRYVQDVRSILSLR